MMGIYLLLGADNSHFSGTSLIGGPTSAMTDIYAQIPNAQPGTGDLEGYYVYPCSTNVSVSLTFGGIAYAIKSEDFSRPADTSGDTCMGGESHELFRKCTLIYDHFDNSAFFGLDLGSGSSVEWIVGDAFLKNVYSVFRQSPAAVGFALAGSGGTSSTSNGNTASSTKGNSPTATNPTSPGSSSGAAGKSISLGNSGVAGSMAVCLVSLFGAMMLL